jgi:hypothetical protein
MEMSLDLLGNAVVSGLLLVVSSAVTIVDLVRHA